LGDKAGKMEILPFDAASEWPVGDPESDGLSNVFQPMVGTLFGKAPLRYERVPKGATERFVGRRNEWLRSRQ
jgi:hypothetical protein